MGAAGVGGNPLTGWKFHKTPPPEKTTTITTTVVTTTTTKTTTQSTVVSYFTSTTVQTTSNVPPSTHTFPTGVRSISTSSPPSSVHSTEKNQLSIRNTVFISLISSLALLSISIIAAYCILTYLNRYLNKRKNFDGHALLLNRGSLMTSMGSFSDASVRAGPIYRVATPDSNLPKANIGTTLPRRSSTESVELFRY